MIKGGKKGKLGSIVSLASKKPAKDRAALGVSSANIYFSYKTLHWFSDVVLKVAYKLLATQMCHRRKKYDRNKREKQALLYLLLNNF